MSDLRTLLSDKLGIAGPDPLRRAGPRLPRRLRRDADFLVRAEPMARHPTLARLIDPREVARAERRLAWHLRGIDPKARRRNRRLNLLAAAGLYALATFALVVTLLWWRGLV